MFVFLYNQLFLHGYMLAIRSSNNKDLPFFTPFMLVLMCFIMHLFTVSMFLNGIGSRYHILESGNKYFFVIIFMIVIAWSYLYKSKYKSILEKAKSKSKISILSSVFFVAIYYLFSAALMLIAALFKNKDWIFN